MPGRVSMVSGFGQYHTNEPGKQNRKPYAPITLDELRVMVDEPPSVPKAEGRWFIPSTLLSRCFKSQATDGKFYCLWADFDINPKPVDQVVNAWIDITFGCDAEFYTSRSATKSKQKSRIIVPLAEGLTGEDWVICQAILSEKLTAEGLIPDPAALRPGQLCYLPNRGEFYTSHSIRSGSLFNPLTEWEQEIEARRIQAATIRQEAEDRRRDCEERRERRKAEGFESLFDAFNAAYTVEDILDRAGYETDGRGNWRHPKSESGNFSASVRDGRVFSMSSSDLLYTGGAGNGAHDAFGAFTVLFAGGSQSTAANLAKTKWLAGWNVCDGSVFETLDTAVETERINDQGEEFDVGSYFAELTLQEEDVKKMAEAEFLIPDMIVRGHIAAYVAPGNGGKTTIFVFLCEQLVKVGAKVFYINVDGSPGDLKRHFAHAAEHGYQVIAPDAKDGKSTQDVMEKLQAMAKSTQRLDNVVFIIDTLKKFVDVISKRDAKEFYKLMRSLSVRGATVCLLGHCNKYRDENGRPIFEGTADLRNDLDELIYLNSVQLDNPKRLEVTTDPDKKRAEFNPKSYIVYLDDNRRVVESSVRLQIIRPDVRAVVELIKAAITDGNTSQKAIVEFVTERCEHGPKKVKQILHEYTGENLTFNKRLTGRGKDLEYSIRQEADVFETLEVTNVEEF